MNSTEIIISTDKEMLDISLIHNFLSTKSYWAMGRTKEEVQSSIENSICFGLYYQKKQIGFARVVTDKTIFAYLMDVFIVEDYRGKGLSKLLMNYIFEFPELKNMNTWFLGTRDAHNLYKQFGFTATEFPERYMIKRKQKNP